MTITARFASRCAACDGQIHEGDLIEWERGQPARHAECPANPEPVAERPADDTLPAMDHPGTREGRMLAAGELTATAIGPDGDHATFYMRCLSRNDDGTWERPDYQNAEMIVVSAAKRGQRFGTLRPVEGGHSMRWKLAPTDAIRAAFDVLVIHLATGDTPAGWRIESADVCGRCGRELTDPESIARGIGPDCFGQMTRAHHIEVVA